VARGARGSLTRYLFLSAHARDDEGMGHFHIAELRQTEAIDLAENLLQKIRR
jgi:hypothetical protein